MARVQAHLTPTFSEPFFAAASAFSRLNSRHGTRRFRSRISAESRRPTDQAWRARGEQRHLKKPVSQTRQATSENNFEFIRAHSHTTTGDGIKLHSIAPLRPLARCVPQPGKSASHRDRHGGGTHLAGPLRARPARALGPRPPYSNGALLCRNRPHRVATGLPDAVGAISAPRRCRPPCHRRARESRGRSPLVGARGRSPCRPVDAGRPNVGRKPAEAGW
jgi:hypothetical protein